MAAGERPIIFSGPMVHALLAGRKTQTRRLIRWSAVAGQSLDFSGLEAGHYCTGVPSSGWVLRSRGAGGCWNDRTKRLRCPFGVPGDRLWVRETFQAGTFNGGERQWVRYRERDELPPGAHWRSPYHMPRWASRLLLEVTEVRAQRLQDISEDDARAEGVDLLHGPRLGKDWASSARDAFSTLWDSINGKRATWAENPWVWAVRFRVLQAARLAASRSEVRAP